MQSTVDVGRASNIIIYIFYSVATVALVQLSSKSGATARCVVDISSRYEEAFCAIKASRFAATVPSLADFRRNSAHMQYLIIKRPAKSLGISLKAANHQPVVMNVDMSGSSADKQGAFGALVLRKQERTAAELSAALETAERAQCQYQPTVVHCGKAQYLLQLNRSNKRLAKHALTKDNRLSFRKRALFSSDQAYLLDSYIRYIEKMLSIGLAGSSYSYSAFAHLYTENTRQGVDFAKRFSATFELLKRDKKTIAPSKRRPSKAPLASECEVLNNQLLVCRSQAMNLVYRRQL